MKIEHITSIRNAMKKIDNYSLETELIDAIKNGDFEQYYNRARGESELYLFGERCNWDRETMIQYCLNNISAWLGREAFEKSFDSGRMKEMAKAYHNAFMTYQKLPNIAHSHVVDGKIFVADWELREVAGHEKLGHNWQIIIEVARDGFVHLAYCDKYSHFQSR